MPICILCSLITSSGSKLMMHRSLSSLFKPRCEIETWRGEPHVARFRCGGCDRPVRVPYGTENTRLCDRTCCNDCRKLARLRRNRERRRVHHEPMSCTMCGKPFVPRRADATTCSNRCRQRLFRQRRATTPAR